MKKIIRVKNLECAHCAAKMEAGISKIEGVSSTSVSFINQKIILDFDESQKDRIFAEIVRICHKYEPDMEIPL